jgi:preprotein translocase subunit SecY
MFIMWVGEQITERGIGNGISLIIFAGIVANLPRAIFGLFGQLRQGGLNILTLVGVLVFMIAIVALIVYVERSQRRIPVQYAKRVVGRKMYGGQSTHIPLRVNTAGVIPIIFASSIMILPTTVAGFVPPDHPLASLAQWFNPFGVLYNVLYAIIIVFFTYFYTAVVLNPNDLAENMRKYGGFVPGIRPGKPTAEYLDFILSRITLPGALYLGVISILPNLFIGLVGGGTALQNFPFGGTAVLIIVGVGLETVKQIESQLMQRNYEGFLR